ncbi:MAG: carboxypeptidase regulatory-like domain-containing protein [Thermoplasmata archaeon]
MAGPGISVRCPSCGTELRAFPAPAPPTQWFPCPHCRTALPVVVPRDPPPLYSWEVLPGLYPRLPHPRAPRWRIAPAIAIALAVVAIASATLGGALAYYGVAATAGGSYTISGTVEQTGGGGADHATVNLTDDAGTRAPYAVGPSGRFSFTGVPSGGVSLNISLSGFAPVTVLTFVSPVYDAGSQGITVTLVPGALQNGTTVVLAPFSNLENFLASVYGAAALLGLAALIAGAAAVATFHHRHRTAGVIGGGAGISAPAVLYLLGLFPAFPIVAAGTAVAAGFGAFALAVTAVDLYRAGTPSAAA